MNSVEEKEFEDFLKDFEKEGFKQTFTDPRANPEGQDSGNKSKCAKSAAKWQETAIGWAILIPTIIGILAATAFVGFIAWVVIGKLWLFLLIFTAAMLLGLWLCHLSYFAEIGKKCLREHNQ